MPIRRHALLLFLAAVALADGVGPRAQSTTYTLELERTRPRRQDAETTGTRNGFVWTDQNIASMNMSRATSARRELEDALARLRVLAAEQPDALSYPARFAAVVDTIRRAMTQETWRELADVDFGRINVPHRCTLTLLKQHLELRLDEVEKALVAEHARLERMATAGSLDGNRRPTRGPIAAETPTATQRQRVEELEQEVIALRRKLAELRRLISEDAAVERAIREAMEEEWRRREEVLKGSTRMSLRELREQPVDMPTRTLDELVRRWEKELRPEGE